MTKHKLIVDVVDCEQAIPTDAQITAIPGPTPTIKLSHGQVCVVQDRTGRSPVVFQEQSPGIYTGDLEPGQWRLRVSIDDHGQNWTVWSVATITMPDHDAHLKDLVKS